MKVWLDDHGALVDYSETAMAPCKDFYHVYATPKEVKYPLFIVALNLY